MRSARSQGTYGSPGARNTIVPFIFYKNIYYKICIAHYAAFPRTPKIEDEEPLRHITLLRLRVHGVCTQHTTTSQLTSAYTHPYIEKNSSCHLKI
jgi:hypothetical protein